MNKHVTDPIASIVIPTYQHAEWLPEAIDSALAQTVPCEVIVVDDGSTDGTAAVLERYAHRIRTFDTPHRGPSAARNLGLERALAPYVMWLDADDVLAPTKVEAQIAEFEAAPDTGWVLCDVLITDDGKRRTERASERYGYADREMGGWIAESLDASNFIPIMSPLVRRSVVDGIRFADTHDGEPEDWRFWQRVAAVARVRYVDQVLATYRKRVTGRNRLPKAARAVVPNIEQPLRLNLGCGTPETRSWHPMPGLVNLDKSLGWRFEDGLAAFTDRSVAGITVSHALMYVAEAEWPAVFAEFARVLVPGGVIRITEDETRDPLSRRVGGWRGSEPAVTLTSPALVMRHLERAGLQATSRTAETTGYRDRSLCQAQHGSDPDVFFVEGRKWNGILFAPHNDDETLFAAFTILRYRPRVVICFESSGDYGASAVREAETRDAMAVLGAGGVEQWAGNDPLGLVAQMKALDAREHPDRVWAPSVRASHPEHVAVGASARAVFGDRVQTYHTYVTDGKVRQGAAVEMEPAWIGQKLRALARYESQIAHPRACQFFAADLLEYLE